MKSTIKMDFGRINMEEINVDNLNLMKWDNPVEEDKVNNPNHYKGKFGLEAIEVVP